MNELATNDNGIELIIKKFYLENLFNKKLIELK